MRILRFFKGKSKADYRSFAQNWANRITTYVHADSLRALIIGFGVGILTVLFFHFILCLTIVLALGATLAWALAE